MEGLIPMIYKSLKKSKARRKYECLSSGTPAQTYNIADFYTEPDYDHFSQKKYGTPELENVNGLSGPHHRRYNSVQVLQTRGFGFEEESEDAKPKQLVRFRSHRMFSCVTGA